MRICRLKLNLIFALCFMCSGCALLSSNDEDVGSKNFQIKFEAPSQPFEKTQMSTADSVWQNKVTGSTIAINSLCKKYENISLESLKKNLLAGIENLNIKSSQKIKFDGREAEKVLVDGVTDGVPVSMSLVIFRKNFCNYDLALIAKKSNFETEQPVFEKFLEGFHVP